MKSAPEVAAVSCCVDAAVRGETLPAVAAEFPVAALCNTHTTRAPSGESQGFGRSSYSLSPSLPQPRVSCVFSDSGRSTNPTMTSEN